MKIESIDKNSEFNWGKASGDYSKYRPGYPESFYELMADLGIGIPGQHILDLGTGTGVLARAFAIRGAVVTGIDISSEQIREARSLSDSSGLRINYIAGRAEECEFPENSFDIASFGQSWLYFDHNQMMGKLKIILVPEGKIVLTHFSWLPLEDEIAGQTEALILKYNPNWSGAHYRSISNPHIESLKDYPLFTYHRFFVSVPFTYESWKGRIRASRAIGAALTKDQVIAFDQEHDKLLRSTAPDSFSVLHEISLRIYGINAGKQ